MDGISRSRGVGAAGAEKRRHGGSAVRFISDSWQRLADWGQRRLATLQDAINRNGFLVLLQATVEKLLADTVTSWAAIIAYYLLFSIFPLLLALIAILAFLTGTQVAQERVLSFLAGVLPVSRELIITNVEAAVQARGVIGVVSVVTLLWSATGILSAITMAFDRAWNVPVGRPFFWQKLLELGLVLAVGALLPLSLLGAFIFDVVAQVGMLTPALAGVRIVLASVVLELVSLAFTFGIFLIVYKVLPNRTIRLGDIWLPTVIAAAAFELVKSLFGWYVARFTDYQLVFGSLAAVAAFLLWAYVSALILLFGAELSAQYARLRAMAVAAERATTAAPAAIPVVVEPGAAYTPSVEPGPASVVPQPSIRRDAAVAISASLLILAAGVALAGFLRRSPPMGQG